MSKKLDHFTRFIIDILFKIDSSMMTEVLIISNQSINLHKKSIDYFLYDKGLRYERINFSLFKYKNIFKYKIPQ